MRHGNGNQLGANLAAARKRAGMTQEELAAQLHVTRQTISNYESMRSQPDISMLTQLAQCLSVSVEELIYGVESQEGSSSSNSLAMTCRNFGIAVYILGILWGIRAGSGARQVGMDQVGFGFLLGDALPFWAGALILGTVLLALGQILQKGISK